MGYPVCVIGEKWEWFGLNQMEGYMEYPEYAKLYIYAEGTEYFRKIEDDSYDSNGRKVLGAFRVLSHYVGKIQIKIYEQEVSRLSDLGVTICSCIVQELNEIEVITKDERKSILLKTDCWDYVSFKKMIRQKK